MIMVDNPHVEEQDLAYSGESSSSESEEDYDSYEYGSYESGSDEDYDSYEYEGEFFRSLKLLMIYFK